MKKHKKWMSLFLAAVLSAGTMLPQTAFAQTYDVPEAVSDMTMGDNPLGVGDTAYEAVSRLDWKQTGTKGYHTDYKRIQFEDLGGINGQDAKITFRCAADEDKMLYLFSLMVGQESEFSYLELAMKIGNGSNFALRDGSRIIRVQYDGKIDFTATVLFFNYGYEASEIQMTQYIEPVLEPEAVITPTLTPTVRPTVVPSVEPTKEPEVTPTVVPSMEPPKEPEITPTVVPSMEPTKEPEIMPTVVPSMEPPKEPEIMPTVVPSMEPPKEPEIIPTVLPSVEPSQAPTEIPMIQKPSVAVVKNVAVSNRKKNQFTVSWKSQKGITGHQIYLRKMGEKRYTKAASVSSNIEKVIIKKSGKKSLSPGTIYEVIVRAYKNTENGNVYGPYSKSITTSTILETPVISLKASDSQLKIQWKQNKKAEGYEIYFSTQKIKNYKKQKEVLNGKTKSTTIKTTADKTYYVKVRAYQTVNGKKVYSSFSKAIRIRNK